MHRDQSATRPRKPVSDQSVMTMMLRETLMGLARVRREVTDLRREYEHLLKQLPHGYAYSRNDGADSLTVDTGRTGFDAAFDEVLRGLGNGAAGDDPWPASKPNIDWDEWERTTKARIRARSDMLTVSTGPMTAATNHAAPTGSA